MRPGLIIIFAATLSSLTLNLAWAEQEKPLQVCTPLSIGRCSSLPQFSGHPVFNVNREHTSELEGSVVLSLVVTSEGKPRDIEVANSTNSELRKIALDAAKSWRFEPGTCDGKPVAAQILARFVLAANHLPAVQLGATAISSADPQRLETLATQAGQAVSRRDYTTAVATAQEVIALAPLATRIRLTLGFALLELDRYDAAQTAFEEEIQLDPSSPFAYDQLGHLYWRQHKYDEAASQFRKQINAIPNSFDAYADLGVMLAERKRCLEAIPALEKALEISPDQARVKLAHGECKVDLGERQKAIQEMEDAASQSGSADSWNQAAYRLADHNVELERAQAWSDTAIAIASAQLKSISLEHLKPTAFRWIYGMAYYWGTRGWIYFRRGDLEMARSYTEPAWSLRPSPITGNHLGQIYEKLGRLEDAKRIYALAIASAAFPRKADTRPEDQAEAMDRLTKLAGPGADISGFIDTAKTDFDSQNTTLLDNPARVIGQADFLMKIGRSGTVSDVRQVSGDTTFNAFAELVKTQQLTFPMPKDAAIQIPRRGTLICESAASQCRFKVLRAEEARDLANKEAQELATQSRPITEP